MVNSNFVEGLYLYISQQSSAIGTKMSSRAADDVITLFTAVQVRRNQNTTVTRRYKTHFIVFSNSDPSPPWFQVQLIHHAKHISFNRKSKVKAKFTNVMVKNPLK